MDYWIFSLSSGEHESSGEAHVFTRAYRAAWRARYGSEPTGAHQVAALDLVIHFGGLGSARVGVSRAGVAPTERYVEPVSAAVRVLPGGRDGD
jgi:hypothetical protein